MKFFSSPRSFALLVLSSMTLEPALALSIDSKAGKFETRLGGYAAPASASASVPFVSPTRRRKTRCSGAGTGIATGTYPTGSGLNPLPQNETTLATTLSYPKSSGTAISLPPVASSTNDNSPIEPTIPNGCGQSTVTVTSEHTVTVTATASEEQVSSGLGDEPMTGSATAALSSHIVRLVPSVVASSGLFSGNGSTPTAAPTSFPSNGNSTTSPSNVVATGKSVETSSTNTYNAVDVSTGASPSSTASSAASSTSPSIKPSTNQTLSTPFDHTGEFWAGADIDTVLRAEALPGRTFYDYDGKTIKDPIKTLGDTGLSSFRVETFRHDCLGPTQWVNNDSSVPDE